MATGETYEEFVEKFKPKLTTDDCYTPPLVYEAVKDWAVNEYQLEGREVIRPFYPGGDYENYDYPENCVVIDNPPFSILAKIKEFYMTRKIDYFLFAPHLTLFSSVDLVCSFVVADADVIYANGAKVPTSFVTNMDYSYIRTAPELKRAVEKASVEAAKIDKKEKPKYKYPKNVISAALLGKYSNADFKLTREECYYVRALDNQRAAGKSIFGNGFLISGGKAAELKAAELAIEWQLSERERAIVAELG